MTVKRIGVDLAKNVFQVHGIDEREKAVIRRRLKRSEFVALFAQLPKCLVGLEASGGAHHWARELQALGHDVLVMAPRLVGPHRKKETGPLRRSQIRRGPGARIIIRARAPHGGSQRGRI